MNGPTNANPPNWVPILEKPVYKPRKLRVVCVGAGYSGLMLAYKWKHQTPMDDFVDLAIYEKNSDVGGTWLENRYPGVACDVSVVASLRDEKMILIGLLPRSRLTSTPSRSSRIPTGVRSMLPARKSGSISSGPRRSTTSTNASSSTARSSRAYGTTRRASGYSRSSRTAQSSRTRPTC